MKIVIAKEKNDKQEKVYILTLRFYRIEGVALRFPVVVINRFRYNIQTDNYLLRMLCT